MGEEKLDIAERADTRHWWQKKRWWVFALILVSPYLAVGSVKLYRAYQFEMHKPEILAALNKLVITDSASSAEGRTIVIPGSKPSYLSLVHCENKVFLNPYEEWSALGWQEEKIFLERKLIELGGVDELAQWFACQGISTDFRKFDTLEVTFRRSIFGMSVKPLWKSAYPFLFDWLPNSDRMIIHLANNRIQTIEFTGNIN